MNIKETLNYLIKQLSDIATASVIAIRTNIFKVTVGNFPKSQEVKGTVIVANLKQEIGKIGDKLDAVEKTLKNTTYPDSVEVRNLKDIPKPEIVKIPEYPKEMKISNPQEKVEVTNLKSITDEIKTLGKKIDGIELAPVIKIDPPQVNVEAPSLPEIKFPEAEKLFSNNPEKSVPVRLTDGKKFYEAIVTAVGGITRAMFSDTKGTNQKALVDEDRHMQVDVLTAPAVSVDTSLIAKESKQLPDNHQVTVSNPTADPETGLAKNVTLTDGNQKTQIIDGSGNLATVTDHKLDVNFPQDNLLSKINDTVEELNKLKQSVAYPPTYDRSVNATRVQVQSGTVTTVSTVTAVTTINNIGSFPGDFLQRQANYAAWGETVRRTIS